MSLFHWTTFALWCQLRGQIITGNIYKTWVFQNWALWKIPLKKLHDSANKIYKNLKILRLSDSMCIQNCLFMNQIEQNEKTVKSFSKLKYCGDNLHYQTRSATKKLLDIPFIWIVWFNVSGLRNLGPNTLRKPQDKTAWVLATLNAWLKVLLV